MWWKCRKLPAVVREVLSLIQIQLLVGYSNAANVHHHKNYNAQNQSHIGSSHEIAGRVSGIAEDHSKGTGHHIYNKAYDTVYKPCDKERNDGAQNLMLLPKLSNTNGKETEVE